jgi:hypothetical protein
MQRHIQFDLIATPVCALLLVLLFKSSLLRLHAYTKQTAHIRLAYTNAAS